MMLVEQSASTFTLVHLSTQSQLRVHTPAALTTQGEQLEHTVAVITLYVHGKHQSNNPA